MYALYQRESTEAARSAGRKPDSRGFVRVDDYAYRCRVCRTCFVPDDAEE